MEKTLQEKAEAAGNCYAKGDYSNGYKAGYEDGYNLHAQESKAMEDKYKRVVEFATNLLKRYKKNDKIELPIMYHQSFINLESALEDLEQNKL